MAGQTPEALPTHDRHGEEGNRAASERRPAATASVKLAEHEDRIEAAKTKGVLDRRPHGQGTRRVRRIIQIAVAASGSRNYRHLACDDFRAAQPIDLRGVVSPHNLLKNNCPFSL